jgi:hypothetical protein
MTLTEPDPKDEPSTAAQRQADIGNVFSWTNPTSWLVHPTTFTLLKALALQNPTPMDINAAQKKQDTPNTQKNQTLGKRLQMPIRHLIYAHQRKRGMVTESGTGSGQRRNRKERGLESKCVSGFQIAADERHASAAK